MPASQNSTTPPDGPVLADLTHYGVIAFSGPESRNFLQNQITNDLRTQSPEQAVFAGYCNAKGRLQANFLVIQRDQDFLLLLPDSLRERTQKRLSMFILRTQTQARCANPEWVRLGLAGPGARALLTEVWGAAPAAGLGVLQHPDGLAIGLADERFDLLVAHDQAAAVQQTLAARTTPIRPGAWDAELIHAGIPTIVPETFEAFTPQMVNLEVLHGVSFQKGCYPGQEVIARTQYLGKVKRRMFLAHLTPGAGPISPGQPLYSAALPDQDCGAIANVVAARDGGYDMLVVARLDAWESGDLHIGSRTGPAVTALPQPYALPE